MGIAITVALLMVSLIACKGGRRVSVPPVTVSQITVPKFNADSAYHYISNQMDFGPRVPNTDAHKQCAHYIETELKRHGAETTVQNIHVTAFDGTVIDGFNIIGAFNPQSKSRILLCAHWDSRPWADNDPDPANRKKPVPAANDGASGVGVILEIARHLAEQKPAIGVDCILFDAEDWGPGDDYPSLDTEMFWGLGTQYWSRSPHQEGYFARYAILLDMVGGSGARFYKEGYSQHYAESIVTKVWDAAHVAGYGDFFPRQTGGYVTDDHLFLNRLAKIPAIDIIPYCPDCKSSGFGDTWHTIDDDLLHIDRSTLQAVGQTVLQVIYTEQ